MTDSKTTHNAPTALCKYLAARTAGGCGWQATYNKQLNQNTAWLLGHYASLLNDVLQLIGDRRITALMAASQAVDTALKAATEDPDGVAWNATVRTALGVTEHDSARAKASELLDQSGEDVFIDVLRRRGYAVTKENDHD